MAVTLEEGQPRNNARDRLVTGRELGKCRLVLKIRERFTVPIRTLRKDPPIGRVSAAT